MIELDNHWIYSAIAGAFFGLWHESLMEGIIFAVFLVSATHIYNLIVRYIRRRQNNI